MKDDRLYLSLSTRPRSFQPSQVEYIALRSQILTLKHLARKLAALERKYDAQFKVVFDAIRELMAPPSPKQRGIGFLVSEKAARYGH